MKQAWVMSMALAAMLLLPAMSRAQNDSPASMKEMQSMYDDGKYADLLPKLIRVVNLRGPLATLYDKFQVWMLKGETHLRLKQVPLAADSFLAASKEAKNKDSAALARATSVLVRRSPNLVYQVRHPRIPPPPGQSAPTMPILEAADRKAAFQALFEDELAANSVKLKAAENAKSLKPLLDAMAVLGDLSAIEFAAGVKEKESKALMESLVTRAKGLFAQELSNEERRVQYIVSQANQTYNDRADGYAYRRGLSSADKKELNEIINTAGLVVDAAADFEKALAGQSKDAGKDLNVVRTRAERVAKQAQNAIDNDYDRTHGR